jgi:hypothetical protein
MRGVMTRGSLLVSFVLATVGCADPLPARSAPPVPASPETSAVDPWSLRGVARIQHDAKRLEALVQHGETKRFLQATAELPSITTRKLFVRPDKSKYYTEQEAQKETEEIRKTLLPYDVDEDKYYNTNFGSPLSYSRPLDVLFGHGLKLPVGSKILDFGYGYVGHLRLLASLGMFATGVDVWPLLPVLYSLPGDQGPIKGLLGEQGSVRLLNGRFPAEKEIVSAIGNGYRLVISKNVLKKGYVHPDRPVENKKMLIDLGASDEAILKSFFDVLEPGGYFLIYNICPALTPPDKPFLPWSDGRSPFAKEQFEKAGFEVVEFDKDDTEAIRRMGKTLGWDRPEDGEPGMGLEKDLSVLYTLVRRPEARK